MKKRGRRRTVWRAFLAAVLVLTGVAGTLAAMFLYRPAAYQPATASAAGEEVSPYLTHYLGPQVHNNIQVDRPFEVVVDQEELNKLIVDGETLGWQWPVSLSGVLFSAPVVTISEAGITIMGGVDIGVEIVVSITASPVLDEDGLFHLNLQSVKAGALNITKLARAVGSQIVAAEARELEEDQWLRDGAAAFLENRPYEPVYPVPTYDKYIRLTRLEVFDRKLVLRFEPAGDM